MTQRSVRITSDGSSRGTRVTDAETGAEIPMVRAIIWECTADDVATARIEVVLPKADVSADAEIHQVCPYCGRGVDLPPMGQPEFVEFKSKRKQKLMAKLIKENEQLDLRWRAAVQLGEQILHERDQAREDAETWKRSAIAAGAWHPGEGDDPA